MRIHTAHEVARAAQQQRHHLGWSQSHLATQIGVTRQWVMALESGKPRLELGLVLRALGALGLLLDVAPMGAPGPPRAPESPSPSRHADSGLLSATPGPAVAPLAAPRRSQRRDHVPAILALSRAAAADPTLIVRALTQPTAVPAGMDSGVNHARRPTPSAGSSKPASAKRAATP